MNTIIRPLRNQLRFPALYRFRSVGHFPIHIGRATHPTKRYFHPFPTMRALQIPDEDRPTRPSKRDPTIETYQNHADELERLMQRDGFRTWGFVVYRCTYQSDSDWESFMSRFLHIITEKLECFNGLDLLDSFAPTVFQDRSFDGADTALLRKHFQEWAATAPLEEQGVEARFEESGRYRFFIMVDLEALESVLAAPSYLSNKTGYVRLVKGIWEPWEPDEDELEALGGLEEHEPLEGCTLEDVGWMKVLYEDAELPGFLEIKGSIDWSTCYRRPPLIQKSL